MKLIEIVHVPSKIPVDRGFLIELTKVLDIDGNWSRAASGSNEAYHAENPHVKFMIKFEPWKNPNLAWKRVARIFIKPNHDNPHPHIVANGPKSKERWAQMNEVSMMTHYYYEILKKKWPEVSVYHDGELMVVLGPLTEGWISGVTTTTLNTPKNMFTKSAEGIVATLKRKNKSKRLGSMINMVQYFINRAGKKLSAERKAELEKAKHILQRQNEKD